jgi:transposase
MTDDNFSPAEYFLNPKEPAQKRYEALRAYFLESLTLNEAAKRAGYSISTFQSLVSNFKNGKVEFFVKPHYGPNKRQTSDFVQKRIVSLRKTNHSVYEIKNILANEGLNTSIQTISRIIKDERLAKLPRRTKEELGLAKKNVVLPQISRAIDLE